MLKGKKGDASEIIMVVILLFFLAVSFLIAAFVNDLFKDAITDTGLNDSDISTTIVNSLDVITTSTIQKGYVAILAMIIIGMLVSSFLIRIHPIFIVIYIIFLAVAIFLALFFGNMYQQVMEVEALAEVAAQQGMINWIMEHIVIITLAIGAFSMVVVFSKIFSPGGFRKVGIR